MTNQTLLALALLFAGWAQCQIVIRGTVKNPDAEMVYLKTQDFKTLENEELGADELSEDGSFEIRFPLNEPRQVRFWLAKYQFVEVLLVPGDSLHVSLDVTAFDSTCTFSGTGSERINLQIALDQYYAAFSKRHPMPYEASKTGGIGLMYNWARMRVDSVAAFLNNWLRQHPHAPQDAKDFARVLARREQFHAAGKVNYVGMMLPYKDKVDIDPDSIRQFMEALMDFPSLTEQRSHWAYRNPLNAWLAVYRKTYEAEHPEVLPIANNYSRELHFLRHAPMPDSVRQMGHFYFVQRLAKYYGELQKAQAVTDSLRQVWTLPRDLLVALNDLIAYHARYAPGQEAPPLTAVDTAGNTVRLSDFRGKVVYIDFWVSGCLPCREELPHARALHDSLGPDAPVVMLNVNMNDIAHWKWFLNRRDVAGLNVNAQGGDNGETAKNYSVTGYPKYILVGKDGRIVSPNAKRPSMGALEQIREVLAKN